MKCSKCQTENRNDSKFCLNCGESLAIATPIDDGIRRPSSSKRYVEGKNPALAAFLSFLVVGLGQVYNGDVLKGAGLLVAALVFEPYCIGAIGIWVFAIYDAHQVAKGSRSLWK